MRTIDFSPLYRSVVGFRGEEALGAGLKAVWQIEGGFALDTGVGSIASRCP